MTDKKWTEAELQQIKDLGLPTKKTHRELELEQQVNTLTKTLEFYASCWNHDVQLESEGMTSMQKDRGKLAREILRSIFDIEDGGYKYVK